MVLAPSLPLDVLGRVAFHTDARSLRSWVTATGALNSDALADSFARGLVPIVLDLMAAGNFSAALSEVEAALCIPPSRGLVSALSWLLHLTTASPQATLAVRAEASQCVKVLLPMTHDRQKEVCLHVISRASLAKGWGGNMMAYLLKEAREIEDFARAAGRLDLAGLAVFAQGYVLQAERDPSGEASMEAGFREYVDAASDWEITTELLWILSGNLLSGTKYHTEALAAASHTYPPSHPIRTAIAKKAPPFCFSTPCRGLPAPKGL